MKMALIIGKTGLKKMYKPEIITNAEYHGAEKRISLLQVYAHLRRIKNSLSMD